MANTQKFFCDQGLLVHKFSTTPIKDTKRVDVQVVTDKAIPIIFLPGILGSPLYAENGNGSVMGKNNVWAWYPDFTMTWMAGLPFFWKDGFGSLSASDRKTLLNPMETHALSPYEQQIESDLVSRIKRSLRSHFLYFFPTSEPLFSIQEALRRGWGTVAWNTAYGVVLPYLERVLRYLTYAQSAEDAQQVEDIQKMLGQVNTYFRDAGLDTGMLNQYLKTAQAYHYPVFAIGYNWLQSNNDSADHAFIRIQEIVDYVRAPRRGRPDSGNVEDIPKGPDGLGLGLRCDDGVILVTHSMGGLVARSLSQRHGEELAGMGISIRGIVHGVQPCNGSATLYYRLRAGWEGGIAGKIIANTGPLLAPLLGSAPGGMELAPNQYYGANWLRVHDQTTGNLLFRLPQKKGELCDPYGDIYLEKDAWWRLTEPELIAPGMVHRENGDELLQEEWKKYGDVVETAQNFHANLNGYFHPNSYVHYGGSPEVKSWANVHWHLAPLGSPYGLTGPAHSEEVLTAGVHESEDNPYKTRSGRTWLQTEKGYAFQAMLPMGQDSGDGVVPYNSANPWFAHMGPMQRPANMRADVKEGGRQATYALDDQWVKALGPAPDPVQLIFEFHHQGFEHGDSYKEDHVLKVTAFSILNVIASTQHPIHTQGVADRQPVTEEESMNG